MDLDGTLINSKSYTIASYRQAFEEICKDEQLLRTWTPEVIEKAVWGSCGEGFKAALSPWPKMRSDIIARKHELMGHAMLELNQPLLQLLAGKNNVTLVTASSWVTARQNLLRLSQTGLVAPCYYGCPKTLGRWWEELSLPTLAAAGCSVTVIDDLPEVLRHVPEGNGVQTILCRAW